MFIDQKEYPITLPRATIQGFENLELYPDLERPQRILGFLEDLSENFCSITISDAATAAAYGGWIADRIAAFESKESNQLAFSLDLFYAAAPDEYGLFACVPQIAAGRVIYHWPATDMWLSLRESDAARFEGLYGKYLSSNKELLYDNLLHLVMIVKNAGDSFEEVLETYLPHIDRWTILDTGSTDGTIETIHRVLAAKRGNLYCEPFVDFATSRNRCLALAGCSSVFTVMLDDTYKMVGDWRGVLGRLRTDQAGDSFSIYIQDAETKYISNRILKARRGLKYLFKIHEVVQKNTNFIIPPEHIHIEDLETPYMDSRTLERNERDLAVLRQCIAEDPDEPRHVYYLAQTYRVLGDKEKAFKTYMQRIHHREEGYYKEKADACFEVIRYGLFEFATPLEDVYYYMRLAERLEPSRPEPWYFLGLYHYFRGETQQAFDLLKKVYLMGYPADGQFNTRPSITTKFTPQYLAPLCYDLREWALGKEVADFYLERNQGGNMDTWKAIFEMSLSLPSLKSLEVVLPEKPILAIIADGNWSEWNGSTLKSGGLGGSETFIAEIARHIKSFDVVVFCRTSAHEVCDGVRYRPVAECFEFLQKYLVRVCLISRFSEYAFAAIHSNVENIYLIAHDIDFSRNMIPLHPKIRGLVALTDFHKGLLAANYPDFQISSFGYGIASEFLLSEKTFLGKRFIYSSGPNRGLLQLLQMWPKILEIIPEATLTICSDLNNSWIKEVYAGGLSEIKKLLVQKGIDFRGWVSKAELRECWARADIWLYPCTFVETFCLTALEAAATKTLVITNNLGSLSEVVADRGIMIPGAADTSEWQEAALEALRHLGSEKELIERNYEWARANTWAARAALFEDTYLLSTPELEYRGMYNWTNDVPRGSQAKISELLSELPRGARILEIGTFAGTSVLGFLARVEKSTAVVIDSWEDYLEKGSELLCCSNRIQDSFERNVRRAGMTERVSAIKGTSVDSLMNLYREGARFDFIYVDSSHIPEDCFVDATLAWRLLSPGGVMLFDDYYFHGEASSKIVDRFVESVGARVLWIDKGRLACRRGTLSTSLGVRDHINQRLS